VLDFSSLPVVEMRKMLKRHNLSVSGKKAEMIHRLNECLYPDLTQEKATGGGASEAAISP